jgi:NAD(P)-dependent dehydrogenase (short-subunit alcohol dehydrogenase family)
MEISGKTAIVTGGTDGIGAATALELKRRGAQVWIIGRSREKGERVVTEAARSEGAGSLHFIQADLSLMRTASSVVEKLQPILTRVDILVHCVGILIAHKEHTPEGIEKDFAVGYLSRFVMTRALVERKLLGPGALLLNVAASGPRIPRMARMEFDDLATVEARYGMQSHGQAQMANDLFSLGAAERWGLSVIGYGPGSVDTGIRRELPRLLVALLKPLFAFSTRKPAAVGRQLAELIERQAPPQGATWFFHKKGRFTPDPFVLDPGRQRALWSVSEALERKALTSERSADALAV